MLLITVTEKNEGQESLEESTRRVKLRLLRDVSCVARLSLSGVKWERDGTSCPGSASRGLFQRGRWGSLREGAGGSFPRIVSETWFILWVDEGGSHGSDFTD